MFKKLIPSTFLISLLLLCCVNNTTPKNAVSAEVVKPDIIVTNNNPEPIYTFVIGADLATRINWAQSLDESIRVTPDNKRTFNSADIFNSENETKAIVYWWVAVKKDAETVPGKINNFVIGLN